MAVTAKPVGAAAASKVVSSGALSSVVSREYEESVALSQVSQATTVGSKTGFFKTFSAYGKHVYLLKYFEGTKLKLRVFYYYKGRTGTSKQIRI